MFPVTPHCQEQGSFATYLDKEEDEFVPLWESKEEGVAVVVVVVTVGWAVAEVSEVSDVDGVEPGVAMKAASRSGYSRSWRPARAFLTPVLLLRV